MDAAADRAAGQRVGTVLVYLNDVAAGGHTSFSKLGLSGALTCSTSALGLAAVAQLALRRSTA